jgi:hypothetical protein
MQEPSPFDAEKHARSREIGECYAAICGGLEKLTKRHKLTKSEQVKVLSLILYSITTNEEE